MGRVLVHPPGGGVDAGQQADRRGEQQRHRTPSRSLGRGAVGGLDQLEPALSPRRGHDRLPAGADHIQEVGPHRPVAVDVAQAGKRSAGGAAPVTATKMPFDSKATEPLVPKIREMRSPCSGEGTSHEWASVPTPPFLVLDHDQHAPLEPAAAPGPEARAPTPPRGRCWPAGRSSAPRPRTARRRRRSRDRPASRAAAALHATRLKIAHLAEGARRDHLAQHPGDRLVAVVLRHHQPPAAPRPRPAAPGRSRRPGGRPASPPRRASPPPARPASARDANSGGVATTTAWIRRVPDRLGVGAERAGAPVLPVVFLGQLEIAAGVAGGGPRPRIGASTPDACEWPRRSRGYARLTVGGGMHRAKRR